MKVGQEKTKEITNKNFPLTHIIAHTALVYFSSA